MKGWRREALGEPLVKLVNDSTRMELTWSEGLLKLA
jgi:hypothetical protein